MQTAAVRQGAGQTRDRCRMGFCCMSMTNARVTGQAPLRAFSRGASFGVWRAVLLGCLRILNLEFCQDVPRRTRCSQPSTTLADFLTQIFCRSRFACGRDRGLCPVQEPIRFLLVQRSYLSMMSKAQIFPPTGSFECSTNRSSISAGLPVMFLPSVNGPGLRCQRATNRGTRPCVLATL